MRYLWVGYSIMSFSFESLLEHHTILCLRKTRDLSKTANADPYVNWLVRVSHVAQGGYGIPD